MLAFKFIITKLLNLWRTNEKKRRISVTKFVVDGKIFWLFLLFCWKCKLRIVKSYTLVSWIFFLFFFSADKRPEQSIASARASVMIYDDLNKKWVPSGSSHGLSKVHIYHHFLNNTFRVVGRKLQDHEVKYFSCLDHTFPVYHFYQLYMQETSNLYITGLVQ